MRHFCTLSSPCGLEQIKLLCRCVVLGRLRVPDGGDRAGKAEGLQRWRGAHNLRGPNLRRIEARSGGDRVLHDRPREPVPQDVNGRYVPCLWDVGQWSVSGGDDRITPAKLYFDFLPMIQVSCWYCTLFFVCMAVVVCVRLYALVVF